MANEIKVYTGLQVNNGLEVFSVPTTVTLVNQVASPPHHIDNDQAIDTTANGTALLTGSVATVGQMQLGNLDPNSATTAYVQIGVRVGGVFTPVLRLTQAGPPNQITPEPGVTLYGLASAGTIPTRVVAIEK